MKEEDRRFYVYAWFNKDWKQTFYVGKGTGDRYKNLKNRSEHFLRIVGAHDCVSKILLDGLTESEALEVEKMTKATLRSLGYPLIDYERTKNELQREGIERAKAAGKYKGGGHEKKIDEAAFQNGYERYMKREITKSELAKELNISRPTLDKILKKRAEQRNGGETE